jgi:hypothetical protein
MYLKLFFLNNRSESKMQKAIIVTGHWHEGWKDNTEELNSYLLEGWTVVNSSPMGAYGYGYSGYGEKYGVLPHSDHGFASLVIIQKNT